MQALDTTAQAVTLGLDYITDHCTKDNAEEVLRELHLQVPSKKLIAMSNLAMEAHYPQQRDNGKPYIQHPLRVWYIVYMSGGNFRAQVQALGHDIYEDMPENYKIDRRELEGVHNTLGGIHYNITPSAVIYLIDSAVSKQARQDVLAISNGEGWDDLPLPEKHLKQMEQFRNAEQHTQLVKSADRIDNLADIILTGRTVYDILAKFTQSEELLELCNAPPLIWKLFYHYKSVIIARHRSLKSPMS